MAPPLRGDAYQGTLNSHYVQSGPKDTLKLEEFTPRPDYYELSEGKGGSNREVILEHAHTNNCGKGPSKGMIRAMMAARTPPQCLWVRSMITNTDKYPIQASNSKSRAEDDGRGA